MARPPKASISPLDCIRVAAVCGADPRTVRAYFDGAKILKRVSEHAIRAALRELGMNDPRATKGLNHECAE